MAGCLFWNCCRRIARSNPWNCFVWGRSRFPAQDLVYLALCCQGCFSDPSCPNVECVIPGLSNELELKVSCYLCGWGRMFVFFKKPKSHWYSLQWSSLVSPWNNWTCLLISQFQSRVGRKAGAIFVSVDLWWAPRVPCSWLKPLRPWSKPDEYNYTLQINNII